MEAATDCLKMQPKEFFCQGMYALFEGWKRCVEPCGGYITEGQCRCTVSIFVISHSI